MKNIIAHRGFWTDVAEQNTHNAFVLALSNGFGIETDLRDHNESLVISHDMPNNQSMTFDTFLNICREYSKEPVLALNVKADGLQDALKKCEISNQHFYFDMSVPDMLGYHRRNMAVYSRYSDIENSPALYNECQGIWLDNFKNETLDVSALDKFLTDGKKVVLVSPELHRRDETSFWLNLKNFIHSNPIWLDLIGLCTDYPSKARDYFNE